MSSQGYYIQGPLPPKPKKPLPALGLEAPTPAIATHPSSLLFLYESPPADDVRPLRHACSAHYELLLFVERAYVLAAITYEINNRPSDNPQLGYENGVWSWRWYVYAAPMLVSPTCNVDHECGGSVIDETKLKPMVLRDYLPPKYNVKGETQNYANVNMSNLELRPF